MARRPHTVPLFATDAAEEDVVEPIEVVRQQGFQPDDRPPAPWFNWLFHHLGEWVNYLRGADPSNWNELEDAPLDVTGAAFDDATGEEFLTIRRILVVNEDGAFASVSGNDWVEVLTADGTFGAPTTVAFSGAWLVGANAAGPEGKIWTSLAHRVFGSALNSTSPGSWQEATLPASVTGINALRTDGNIGESCVVVAATPTKLLYSTDAGFTFEEADLEDPATGEFVDAIWDGTAWIAVTDDGELYRTTNVTAEWDKLATDLPNKSWKFATNNLVIVAVPRGDADGSSWYVSEDNGTTWDAHTPPEVEQITTIEFIDSQWILGSHSLPFLMTANALDEAQWVRAVLPIFDQPENDDPSNDVSTILLARNALLLFGETRALISHRARETTPGPWAPSETPPILHDAAYLRGTLIESAAPSNGDSLTYNSATQQLEWAPAGGSGISYANEISALTVRVATTADITLSGEQTIDGIAVVTGDRVLVKSQSTGHENGIYVVDAGAWSRASDASDATELLPGRKVSVAEGTAGGDVTFTLTTNAPITIGATTLTFTDVEITKHTTQTLTGVKTHDANLQMAAGRSIVGLDQLTLTGNVNGVAIWSGGAFANAAFTFNVGSSTNINTFYGDTFIYGPTAILPDPGDPHLLLRALNEDTFEVSAGAITAELTDDTEGAEDGKVSLSVLVAGSPADRIIADSDKVTIAAGIRESGTVTVADLNHTVLLTHRNVVYTSISVPRTVTLPPLADCPLGHRITIWGGPDVVANGPITIDGDSGDTINGSSDIELDTDYGKVDLISLGSSWRAHKS